MRGQRHTNGIINTQKERGLTIVSALLLKVNFLRRERVLALRRVWYGNVSLTNGDVEFGADGTFPVFYMLLENILRLSNTWMRTDISRILAKEAFFKDDTLHHVRRTGRTIFVNCFTNCIVTHAGAGDGWGEKLIMIYQIWSC
jgi:hypothetical protein